MLLLQHLLAVLLAQSFEAASVKPVPSDPPLRSSRRGGPGTSDPSQFTFTNVTLAAVIVRAYDVKNYQVSGPDWLSSRRYTIVARTP